MKKSIEVFLIITILGGLAVLLCGCEVAQLTPPPTLRSQTMTLDTSFAGLQWKEAFSDSVDSAQSFNLWLLNAEFDKLKKRIEGLEVKNAN